ncbi:hypothetical protein BJF78_24725 [Pseudonocardia sp. CNS-139]|nr:hypothetical protein BJF78_24725 [Pseudonocardia sp. CNS-139]
MALGDAQKIDLELDWSAGDSVEPKAANQFVVQLGPTVAGAPDGVYLIVGQVAPPLVVSNVPEKAQAQIERYGGRLQVHVHGRYHMSRARLDELRRVLDLLAEQYDEQASSGEQPA